MDQPSNSHEFMVTYKFTFAYSEPLSPDLALFVVYNRKRGGDTLPF